MIFVGLSRVSFAHVVSSSLSSGLTPSGRRTADTMMPDDALHAFLSVYLLSGLLCGWLAGKWLRGM